MNLRQMAESRRQKEALGEFVISLHHILCREYGWIPFTEFLELPIPTVMNLYDKICEEKENERKQIENMRKK